MDQDRYGDDITDIKSSPKKIDDFKRLKDNTMDFLMNERAEKFDVEKPKVEVDDDFLNFHDDIGDAKKPHEESPKFVAHFDRPAEKFEEPKMTQPEPEIDFHALDDEYELDVNPYAASQMKPQNEKFISSEDLLTDFKDIPEVGAHKPVEFAPPMESMKPMEQSKPVEIPKPVEVPKPVEEPRPVEVTKPTESLIKQIATEVQPPVTEAFKPVVSEPSKPKTAPPPAPVKKPTSDDTQIEAEKIFKDFGLG